MSTREAGADFVSEIADAIERLTEADIASLARHGRVEGQLLELQLETRQVLKSLLEGQKELHRLLTTNGTGGDHG